jgi:hypothetical protein
VNEPEKSAQPVSMTKGPAHADVPGKRPTTVLASAATLAASGVAAFGAAIGLYGQRTWLTNELIGAHSTSISNAVKSAVVSATKSAADPTGASASASSSASSSAVKEWPTTASGVHSQVSQQQSTTLLMTIFFAVALAFIVAGVYRGRHWARWGTVGFWFVASFITPFGIGGLLSIGANVTAAYKVPLFLAALLFTVGVVLANLRPSTEYFALSRPEPGTVPARRGLFAPRTPPQRAGRPGSRAAPERPTSLLRSSAASRGEAYVEKQRAKKRAAADADAVKRGAELARSRAKASKSRRSGA